MCRGALVGVGCGDCRAVLGWGWHPREVSFLVCTLWLFVGRKGPLGTVFEDLLKKFNKDVIINMVSSRNLVNFVAEFSDVVAERSDKGAG